MADSQRSDVFVLESESQLFNRIISQEFNERDSDDEQSSLQSQQMMQGDQTMNTSASSEAQGAPINNLILYISLIAYGRWSTLDQAHHILLAQITY